VQEGAVFQMTVPKVAFAAVDLRGDVCVWSGG